MKPVDQTCFFVPGESCGNCQQAAVASILGLDLSDVPNFVEDPAEFWPTYHTFLRSRGFIDVALPKERHPDCFYLAYGPSSRGVQHAVIYRAGKLVHDPHPSREGILEVREVHLIVPIEIGAAS